MSDKKVQYCGNRPDCKNTFTDEEAIVGKQGAYCSGFCRDAVEKGVH